MERLSAVIFIFSCLINLHLGAPAIGVNYGLNGDNLPPPATVVLLLKSRNISRIRLFEPNPEVLKALQGAGLLVILGTRNEDIQPFASDPNAALSWVQTNIVPYIPSLTITHISIGNEVIPSELAQFVPLAMQNVDFALNTLGIPIPVTTAVSMAVLAPSSFPPSKGAFSEDVIQTMTEIALFLETKHYPLLLNAYTWFPRISDPENVHLDYALLEDTAAAVPDDQYTYYNLFDAMVDTVYAALEKVGGPDVEIIVSETGWPTEGNVDASIENARTYNNNLIKRVYCGRGTPRRPDREIKAYIFALFNEDLKPEGVEQHWGLYYPDLTEVYHVDFPVFL